MWRAKTDRADCLPHECQSWTSERLRTDLAHFAFAGNEPFAEDAPKADVVEDPALLDFEVGEWGRSSFAAEGEFWRAAA